MSILRLSTLSLTLAIAAFSLGYVNPSFAAPKDCDGADAGTPRCGGGGGDGGGGEKDTFSVMLVGGPVSGNSLSNHPWRTSSKHGIGESDPHVGREALELFGPLDFIPGGDNCFGGIGGAFDDFVREASIRERRGAMESMFWFDGETDDDTAAERQTVTYIFHMDGILTTVGDFPPAPLDATSMMTMDNWRINVANNQADVEPFACEESFGVFGDSPVLINVTNVTPLP